MSPHDAHLAVAFLIAFIAGVAVAAVTCWFARDRIKAAMMRRRGRD